MLDARAECLDRVIHVGNRDVERPDGQRARRQRLEVVDVVQAAVVDVVVRTRHAGSGVARAVDRQLLAEPALRVVLTSNVERAEIQAVIVV